MAKGGHFNRQIQQQVIFEKGGIDKSSLTFKKKPLLKINVLFIQKRRRFNQ